MNRILLIDGNSLLFRAYYGSAYASAGILKTSKGIPVNAVLTFNNMLNKYISKINPTHIHVAFDAGKKTFRHDKMESYKAGRREAPEEMKPQWPIVKEMLEKMGISYGQKEGIEADDIIGILSTNFKGDDIYILSSDKDLYQLISENVTVIAPQSGTKPDKFISHDNIKELMGVRADQIIDYKALVGDTSDNLPGVKGIGPKGAVKLLEKYDNLDNIYLNIDSISGSAKTKLETYKDSAFLCQYMATIILEDDYTIELEKMLFFNKITPELITFYKNFELNSLVKRYEKLIDEDKKDFDNFLL